MFLEIAIAMAMVLHGIPCLQAWVMGTGIGVGITIAVAGKRCRLPRLPFHMLGAIRLRGCERMAYGLLVGYHYVCTA